VLALSPNDAAVPTTRLNMLSSGAMHFYRSDGSTSQLSLDGSGIATFGGEVTLPFAKQLRWNTHGSNTNSRSWGMGAGVVAGDPSADHFGISRSGADDNTLDTNVLTIDKDGITTFSEDIFVPENKGYRFGDDKSGIFGNGDATSSTTNNFIKFVTADSEKMRIDGNGNVGIGEASSEGAESLLHVRGTSSGALLDVIRIDNDSGSTSTESGILFETGQLSMARISAMNQGSDLGALRFWTSGSSNTPSERMRINASGKVGIGVSPNKNLQVSFNNADTAPDTGNALGGGGAGDGLLINNLNETTNAYANLDFRAGSHDCRIAVDNNGTANEGNMYFIMDNSGNYEKALTLHNNLNATFAGNVGVGSANVNTLGMARDLSITGASDVSLTIHATSESLSDGTRLGQITFMQGSTAPKATASIQGYQEGTGEGDTSAGGLIFGTRASGQAGGQPVEAMRIDDSGKVGVGETGPSTKLHVKGSSITDVGVLLLQVTDTSAADHEIQSFYDGGGTHCGEITVHATNHTTAYVTSSDYRLKENDSPISDGLTRLNQLKPKRFNFKSNPNKTKLDGFFAHEVSSIVPEAIMGDKDGMKINPDTGEEEMKFQGIDHSKLVPLLVSAVQELSAKVEALENA
jgi:hypothetical protein